jgi:hypothetical protein
MSDETPMPKKRGCLFLVVPTLIVLDTVGMVMGLAGRYQSVIVALAWGGCGCGGAIGAYIWFKCKDESEWTLSFYIVAFGLLGLLAAVFIPLIILGLCGVTNPANP